MPERQKSSWRQRRDEESEREKQGADYRETFAEWFAAENKERPIKRREFLSLYDFAVRHRAEHRWYRRAWRWFTSLFQPRVIIVNQPAPAAPQIENGDGGAERAAEGPSGLIVQP